MHGNIKLKVVAIKLILREIHQVVRLSLELFDNLKESLDRADETVDAVLLS